MPTRRRYSETIQTGPMTYGIPPIPPVVNPTFVASAGHNGAAIAIPANAVVGNFAIACIMDNGSAPPTPSGWAVVSARTVAGAVGCTAYSKVLQNGDPGSLLAVANASVTACFAYKGTSGVDTHAVLQTGGFVGNIPGPQLNLARGNEIVLLLCCIDGNPPVNPPAPSGTTDRLAITGGFEAITGVDDDYVNSGLTVVRTFVASPAPSLGSVVIAVAIKP